MESQEGLKNEGVISLVTLIDSNGRGRTNWDKNSISIEELKRFFPDTLGGIVDVETRLPIRETKDSNFDLVKGKTYEIRVPLAKEMKMFPPELTNSSISASEEKGKQFRSEQEAESETLSNDEYDPMSDESFSSKNGKSKSKRREIEPPDSDDSQEVLLSKKRRTSPIFPIAFPIPHRSHGYNGAPHTWSELIEEALMRMPGPRTGQEITSYIEQNYDEMVSNKTKTWRNSVMGCLSSNARKLWVKEQTVVDNKRRYVWQLTAALQQQQQMQQQQQPNSHKAEITSPFAAKALSKLGNGASPSASARKKNLFPEKSKTDLLSSPSKAPLLLLSSLADSQSLEASKLEDTPTTSPETSRSLEEDPILTDVVLKALVREGLRTLGKVSQDRLFEWLLQQCALRSSPALRSRVDSVLRHNFPEHQGDGQALWSFA